MSDIEKKDDVAVSGCTVKGEEQGIIIDPDYEKRVRRKIDRVILPLLAMTFFFQCASQTPCEHQLHANTQYRPGQTEHWLRSGVWPHPRSEPQRWPIFVGH